MFGRRRDEDYDEYNEKYASKYDDDYIAPSHDYRKDCTHSHEQTYEDMDDIWECRHSHEQSYEDVTEVRECDHSHEQTYADADSEQHSYDSYASLESRFQKYLYPNEHLLWAGGHDKLSPEAPEVSRKKARTMTLMVFISIILMSLSCISQMFCVFSLIGFAVFGFSLYAIFGNYTGIYAITDMRVINRRNDRPVFAALTDICKTSAAAGRNNTGYVAYTTMHPLLPAQSRQNGGYQSVIAGITDPHRVKRILDDAVHSAMINSQRK